MYVISIESKGPCNYIFNYPNTPKIYGDTTNTNHIITTITQHDTINTNTKIQLPIMTQPLRLITLPPLTILLITPYSVPIFLPPTTLQL